LGSFDPVTEILVIEYPSCHGADAYVMVRVGRTLDGSGTLLIQALRLAFETGVRLAIFAILGFE
jgi:hypothetical protein